MILGLGKLDTCFIMLKVRLVKDLKKKIKSSIRKCFFYESLWSKFSFFFFHWPFLDGIKAKAYIIANFHKFEHLWFVPEYFNR